MLFNIVNILEQCWQQILLNAVFINLFILANFWLCNLHGHMVSRLFSRVNKTRISQTKWLLLSSINLHPQSSTYPSQVSSRDVYPRHHRQPIPRSSRHNDFWNCNFPPSGTRTCPPHGVDSLPSESTTDPVLAIDSAANRSRPTRHMIGSPKSTRMTALTGDEDSRPGYWSCIKISSDRRQDSFGLSDRTKRISLPRRRASFFRKYSSSS